MAVRGVDHFEWNEWDKIRLIDVNDSECFCWKI